MLLRSAFVTVVELLSVPNMNGLKTAEMVTSATTFPVSGAIPVMSSVKVLHPEGTVKFP